MIRAIVYDRCIDAARSVCLRLLRRRIAAVAVHPTDFDLTFEPHGVPNLLITELEMPLFSGFELIRRVRSAWGESPPRIIAYTMIDDAGAWQKARDLGADEVVYKGSANALKRLDLAITECLVPTTLRPAVMLRPAERLAPTLGVLQSAAA